MFAKTIIDSDAFLDMPLSTQALYFHLSMRADDDGFINNPKKITRMIGCNEDELKLLCAKKFIIPFESGIVVIKHWRIHNYIRKDMYKETKYKDEKSQLDLDENNAYTQSLQVRNEVVTESSTQVRLGKDRLELGKDKKEYFANAEVNRAFLDYLEERKNMKAPVSDKAIQLLIDKLYELTKDEQEMVKIINNATGAGWKSFYPLKKEKVGFIPESDKDKTEAQAMIMLLQGGKKEA